MSENAVIAACTAFLSTQRHIRIWRMNCGAAKRGTRYTEYGQPGQADYAGIVGPHGRRIEVEFKRPGGKQSKDQITYEAMIRKHGGIYLLVDSVESLIAGLRAAGALGETNADATRDDQLYMGSDGEKQDACPKGRRMA